MIKFLLVFFIFFVSGFAKADNVSDYANKNLPLARAGEMQWSDYYKGAFDELSKSNSPGTGDMMIIANKLIDSATAYENGEITKQQFESAQKMAIAETKKLSENIQPKKRPDIKPYMFDVDSYKTKPLKQAPTTTNCYKAGNNVTCNTY